MCAHKVPDQRSFGATTEAVLTWLGGGHRVELSERHERSTHAIAGALVLLGGLLACLAATFAVDGSARWPLPALVPLTVAFGLLVGAVTRATVSGQVRGWPGVVGRGAVAIAVGGVVAELAALVLFSGSIDRRLDEQAARRADSSPAVVQASAALEQTRQTRAALDDAVERARRHRDEALVIARCEYNPSPACPQTRITGVPGAGPETRTANDQLADTQRELDNAVAARDREAPEVDAKITDDEQALARAGQNALGDTDRGLGARWVAMHELTLANPGALLLRLLTLASCILLYVLPLILRLWRGETMHDRHAAARAVSERAELDAETAIAVKRAEVRAAAETLWAEHRLAQARLAVETQTEIDRARHRRRVTEALEAAVHAPREDAPEPVDNDVFLPIAAEADAAGRTAMQLPASAPDVQGEANNLPARDESGGDIVAERFTPTIPDVTKAAARWIRPLVPTIVARAIDTTTQPLRAARQVLEEVEEITFSFKRTRKVTVDSEESLDHPRRRGSAATDDRHGVESSVAESAGPDYGHHRPIGARTEFPPHGGLPARKPRPALAEPDGLGQLGAPEGPPQLPSGK